MAKPGDKFTFDKVRMPQIQGRSANVVEYNIVGQAAPGITAEAQVIDWQVPIGECMELLALKVFAPAAAGPAVGLNSVTERDNDNREWNTFCTQYLQEMNVLPFWNPYLFPKNYTLKLSEGDHLRVVATPVAATATSTYITACVRRYKSGSVPAEVYKNFDIYKGGMKGRAQYYERTTFDFTYPVASTNQWFDALTLDVTKNEAYYLWTAGIMAGAGGVGTDFTTSRIIIDDQIEYNQYTLTTADGANELPFMETVQLDVPAGATSEYIKKMARFNPVIKVVKNLNRNLKVQVRGVVAAPIDHNYARLVGVRRVLV